MPDQVNEHISPENIESVHERQQLTALRIAEQAVVNAKVPQHTGDDTFTDQQWRIYYKEENRDIVLSIELLPIFTRAVVHSSLGSVAWEILREMEILFSSPKAIEQFCVEGDEPEAVIFERSVKLVTEYIIHLPMIMFHSFHQTLNLSLISHIKKFVEYDLREHWNSQGKDKKYTLLPNDELRDLTRMFADVDFQLIPALEMRNQEFEAYRKGAFNERKVFLTPEVFSDLPAKCEELGARYKEAKKEQKEELAAYTRYHRGNLTGWKDHWEKIFDEKYPNLFLTEDLEHDAPMALARRQLGMIYGFPEDYIRQLVNNAKAQKEGKKQAKQKKWIINEKFSSFSRGK